MQKYENFEYSYPLRKWPKFSTWASQNSNCNVKILRLLQVINDIKFCHAQAYATLLKLKIHKPNIG